MGNSYINIILKNFVIFLDKKLNNLEENLFEVLNKLFLFDISNLIDKDIKNKTYTFYDINSILSNCDKEISQKFEMQKSKFREANFGIFSIVRQNLDKNLKKSENTIGLENIQLISVDEKIYSNNITLIIDLYSKKDKNKIDDWKDFIDYFNKETMFYFFQWSCDSKNYLLKKGKYKKMKKISEDIISARNISKICGKILAYILISNKFFKNFQINLIGFNLGGNVIKHCIKELSRINKNDNFMKIKNVILIGAATHFKNEDNWKKRIEEIVLDKFINCYSSKDEILKNFYSICNTKSNKNPVGIESLEIKNDKGNNLVLNYDFSKNDFDHLSYKLEDVVKTIYQNYKDI